MNGWNLSFSTFWATRWWRPASTGKRRRHALTAADPPAAPLDFLILISVLRSHLAFSNVPDATPRHRLIGRSDMEAKEASRYEKPTVTDYGTLRELTRGSGGSATPDILPCAPGTFQGVPPSGLTCKTNS
ncbi:MAG: lasso RiPP family leader peptide-containing protein [Gaiellaceae bacterium]